MLHAALILLKNTGTILFRTISTEPGEVWPPPRLIIMTPLCQIMKTALTHQLGLVAFPVFIKSDTQTQQATRLNAL